MLKNILLVSILSILTLVFLKSNTPIFSQTMSNSQFIIEMGNLNSFAGKPTNSQFKLSVTGGQSGQGLFTGPNYKVKVGYQYVFPLNPFRFSISSTIIDFGIISPTIPVTRSNQLTVSNTSAYGYQVLVSQNHNLRSDTTGTEIPQTSCNSGSCTPTTAAEWSNNLSYGFGYRCDNNSETDCESQFLTTDFYKPFISSPSSIMIMSSANSGDNKISTITYKVNVSQLQQAGLYTNILNYIAMPTY